MSGLNSFLIQVDTCGFDLLKKKTEDPSEKKENWHSNCCAAITAFLSGGLYQQYKPWKDPFLLEESLTFLEMLYY